MIRRWLSSARADVTRPLSAWTMVTLMGSVVSILFLAVRGGIPYPKHFDTRDFAAECVLVASVWTGIVGLTRSHTGKAVLPVILLLDFGLAWFYLVTGFFDVPWVLLSNLFRYPSLAGALALAAGLTIEFLGKRS